MKTYKAYVVSQNPDGGYEGKIIERELQPVQEGEVRIKVLFSSLNYKDVLSASGNKGVTKAYPHVPGIDAAGIVEESSSDRFKPGDEVIVTGYDLGMNTDGGFQQYITVPDKWGVRMPEGLDSRKAMCYGTAGFTAAQCVEKITSVIDTGDGPVLVSGSTGGVGSFSTAILSKLGYLVICITGKPEDSSYLKSLGAFRIDERKKWDQPTKESLMKGEIAGGIDVVGGHTLENMLKSVKLHGAVSCCGMISSPDIDLTVFPFILRGISLFGVSSQNTLMFERLSLWKKIAGEYNVPDLASMVKEIGLADVPEYISLMQKGKVTGRVIINLQK